MRYVFDADFFIHRMNTALIAGMLLLFLNLLFFESRVAVFVIFAVVVAFGVYNLFSVWRNKTTAVEIDSSTIRLWEKGRYTEIKWADVRAVRIDLNQTIHFILDGETIVVAEKLKEKNRLIMETINICQEKNICLEIEIG